MSYRSLSTSLDVGYYQTPTLWTGENLKAGIDACDLYSKVDGDRSFKIKGEFGTIKRLYTNLTGSEMRSGMYTLSGWAMANSASLPEESERDTKQTRFELSAKLYYFDRTEEFYSSFDAMNTGWQFTAVPFRIDTNCLNFVQISLNYSDNINECYFDNICLCKSEGSKSIIYENDEIYTVDSSGNSMTKDLTKDTYDEFYTRMNGATQIDQVSKEYVATQISAESSTAKHSMARPAT